MKKKFFVGMALVLLMILTCGILSGCGSDGLTAQVTCPNGNRHVIGSTVQLEVKKQDEDLAVTLSLRNNTAGAVLNGTTLTANTEGKVTVEGTYWIDGDERHAPGITIEFYAPSLTLDQDGFLKMGDRVKLSCSMLPIDALPYNPSYFTYEVLSGDATLSRDGAWYMTVLRGGPIKLKVTYVNGDIAFSRELELEAEGYTFSIAAAEEQVKKYYDIPLKMTECTIPDFDESKIVYVTDTPGVTVEGNVIKATDAERIRVWATYELNGISVKSNVLEFTLDGDVNAIQTASDLQKLNGSGSEFVLLSDIDLSSYDNWTPITGFSGTLNGNGHKITGMKLTVSNRETDKGLFDVNRGTIRNLTVEGTLSCRGEASNLGILCGQNAGSIQNVTVSGTLDAPYSDKVGGIIGNSETSNLSDLTSYVKVTARNGVSGIAGGISATRSETAVLKNLTNHGVIHGASSVGGIFGTLWVQNGKNNDTVTAQNLTNNGAISGTGDNVGGIFGWMSGNIYSPARYEVYESQVIVTDCKNTATVSGMNGVGGIVGTTGGCVREISACENTADISGNLYVGGYLGTGSDPELRGLVNKNIITGTAYVGGIVGKGHRPVYCENKGNISVQDYYLDDGGKKLSYVGGIAGYAHNIVNCTNYVAIDVSTGGSYVGGIAGYVSATRNASFPNNGNKNYGEIKGTAYVGGIAGRLWVQEGENDDTVEFCDNVNDADVVGSGSIVGGLIGELAGRYYSPERYEEYLSCVKVMDCENNGTVSGTSYVGGLFGNADAYVSEIALCKNTGDVSGEDYVGGYVGRAAGTTMRLLTNNATVTGRGFVGGIAGYAGKVVECENNGTLVITGYILSGEARISKVGGIAGYATGAVDCVNNAAIDASAGGLYVGGIVGQLAALRSDSNTVSGNKNYGEIKGWDHVGGIAGEMFVLEGKSNVTLTVSKNVNDGEIIAIESYAGGIFGWLNGNYYTPERYEQYLATVKVQQCQNSADVSGVDYVGGIVGQATAYVDKTVAIWETNRFTGMLNTEGAHQGALYGSLG